MLCLLMDLDILILVSHAPGCSARTTVETANGAIARRTNKVKFELGCDPNYATTDERDRALKELNSEVCSIKNSV